MRIDESGKTSEIGCGRLAADGTGGETDVYGLQERPLKKGGISSPYV